MNIKGVIKTGTIIDRFVERNTEELKVAKRGTFSGVYPKRLSFFDALQMKKENGKLALITEIKKMSPSMGVILASEEQAFTLKTPQRFYGRPESKDRSEPMFRSWASQDDKSINILQQAITYEKSGASAISVLTQPLGFEGILNDLKEISDIVSLPLLRKDFIIDSYQISEAKMAGASAVLLIAMILEESLLKELIIASHEIGLDVLVEAHDEKEVEKAVESGAKIIGVNARDLRTLKVDGETFHRVIPHIPKDIIRVAESGIETGEDVQQAKEAGADAILVGTSLMRSENPGEKIRELLRD